jgi:hypothetical protein
LAGACYKNGIRSDMLEKGTDKLPNKAYDKALVTKLFGYCAEYLSKNDRDILFAPKTSLTKDQLKDQRKLQMRINEKMSKLRDYLKDFNDIGIGANKKIPLGDRLGDLRGPCIQFCAREHIKVGDSQSQRPTGSALGHGADHVDPDGLRGRAGRADCFARRCGFLAAVRISLQARDPIFSGHA